MQLHKKWKEREREREKVSLSVFLYSLLCSFSLSLDTGKRPRRTNRSSSFFSGESGLRASTAEGRNEIQRQRDERG